MREINRIILHCSATQKGETSVQRQSENGIAHAVVDIGYHFVVLLDGTIEAGRPLDKAGAHVKGTTKTPSVYATLVGQTQTAILRTLWTDAKKPPSKN